MAQVYEFQVFHGGSIESIRIVEYDTLEDALDAIDSGAADLLGHRVNESDYSTIDSYDNIEEQWAYDNQAFFLSLNAKYYPLSNEHLRRAIAYAVNKTDIVENALDGQVDELDFVLPLFNEYCVETEQGGEYYDADLVNAVYELELAGMLDVDEDGVVEGPDGSEVCIPIWYPIDIIGLNETVSLISLNLDVAGINNTLVPMNFIDLQYEIANHNQTYGIALYQQELDQYAYEWTAMAFHVSLQSEPGYNIANIDDDQLNDLAEDYIDAIQLDSAESIGYQAMMRIFDICPVIPLFSYRWLSVYSNTNFGNWPDDTYAGAFSLWSPVTVTAIGASSELVVAVLPTYFDNFFKSLNPFYENTTIDPDWIERHYFNPYLLVYDSPMATAPDGHAVPRHATSWEMQFLGIVPDLTNDESRVNYYSDPNANWTDGMPMDAQDYRFTFEYLQNNSLSIYANGIDEVKVTGRYLAGIEYDSRDMYLFRKFGALPILPEHIWSERNATGWNPTVGDVIGSGPFSFESFTQGSEVVLDANPNYYPEIDTDAPTLRSISFIPEAPIPAESVVFRVFVDDRSIVENVSIYYTYQVGRINFTDSQIMVQDASGFQATIPARVTANAVIWEIHATDIWGNSAKIANGSYFMDTGPQIEPLDLTLPLLIAAGFGMIVVIYAIVRRRSKVP
ncbi:MAG: ABC transporter substrate-binding protein [Candidatus Thorarchaeota archaeon]